MYRDGEIFCLYRFLVCYMKRSLVINLSGPARSGTFFLGPSSWSECLTQVRWTEVHGSLYAGFFLQWNIQVRLSYAFW